MPSIHTVFGDLKTWINGCYHGVRQRYLPAYLGELTYRFNRRGDIPDLFGWVTRRLMTRPPTTLAAIQKADASAQAGVGLGTRRIVCS